MQTSGIELNDRDRAVFEEEIAPWLPARVFDAHIHVLNRESFINPPTDPRSCYNRFGGEYTFEQCDADLAALLPGRELGYLSFGTPGLHVDTQKAACYTASGTDRVSRFGLSLISPYEPVADVERRIREYRLAGYKPYYNFVKGKAADQVTVFDMISAEQMELADRLGLVITFHIPRAGRLADPLNQRQMVELCRRYPGARIVYAHIGRAYFLNNVIGQLDGLRDCENAYLDTAMVNHAGVLEYTFKHFPRERILFGSDAPIAMLRGKSVEINNQYAYLMGEDYRIGTAIYDADRAVEFTFFYYEQLRAIGQAAERAGLDAGEIDGIMGANALSLLTSDL